MKAAAAPTLLALALQLALGVAIFYANRKRLANQCFLLLSAVIVGWLGSLFVAFMTGSAEVAELAIREASAFGALYLPALNLLRLAVVEPSQSWRTLIYRSRYWLMATGLIVLLCPTGLFLQGAALSPTGSAPAPEYGAGVYAYVLYYVSGIVVLLFTCVRNLRTTTGREHTELSFIFVAGVSALAASLLVAQLLKSVVDPTQLVWFAPFRVILFSLVVAYGIATQRIMEVGLFFRRLAAYALLATYLLVLYGAVWWITRAAFEPTIGDMRGPAHLVAAIVVAFAMAPARGVSQALANRLSINSRQLDFQSTMRQAAEILQSVTTLRDLLDRFAKTIRTAVDAESVMILLSDRREFAQQYPLAATNASRARLAPDDPLIAYLQTHRDAVVLDELYRIRQTPEIEAVTARMEELRAAVAIGISARQHLAGVMFLGARLSGRIYGTIEQNALQVLCGQLAVAIENARLFTEVQNAKIYNETLLENLTTGVVAAGGDGRITVFNREAEQITGLAASAVLEQSIDQLPEDLQHTLRVTLATGERQENADVRLGTGEREIIARVSSSVFHGEEGQRLGALMVLTDVTALKRLEAQIRRSDRLASLGTLSAGMAHEIKNPLVSIKTFTQLLPERYQDSDFRETFSNLIGHEIDRIDSLVNQLLRFARPAKPVLKPMHVHEVLEKSLMLVGHRLYQKEIKLTRSWDAEVDTIRADADQLEQVFLNFFLNAMDAMEHGGELSVETQIRRADSWVGNIGSMVAEDTHEVLVITIRDNGEGIAEENVGHVFDPFFTTKDYGTGLGLSVVHGIIQEHGGQIEVESEVARGTAFHITLPLVRFSESEVAAA